MKPYERLELPMIVEDENGREREVARLVYVLERTCKLKATTVGWSCSACHVVSWQTVTKPKPNYCPYCGARVVE